MARVRDFLVAGPSGTTIHPAPTTVAAAAALPAVESTQVLASAPAPGPTAEPAPPPAPRERRSARASTLLIAGGLVALAVLLVIAWTLITAGDEPTTDPSGTGSDSPSQTDSPSETEDTQTSEPAQPNAEDMQAFIADYLATAPSDPQATFQRLTPQFQEESGGAGGYTGYWNTIESATPVEINADPEALTVAYTVDYVRTDGSETTDNVVLGLVFRDGQYLIARED